MGSSISFCLFWLWQVLLSMGSSEAYRYPTHWQAAMGLGVMAVIQGIQVVGSLGLAFLKAWGRRIVIATTLVAGGCVTVSGKGAVNLLTLPIVWMPVIFAVILLLPSGRAVFQSRKIGV